MAIAELVLSKVVRRVQELEPEDIPASAVDRIFRTAVDVQMSSLGVNSKTEVVHEVKSKNAPPLAILVFDDGEQDAGSVDPDSNESTERA